MNGEAFEEVMEFRERKYLLMANPVTVSGAVKGAVLMMIDVTEKEEREELRKEFSANVSHELKTPLTTISGYAGAYERRTRKAGGCRPVLGKDLHRGQKAHFHDRGYHQTVQTG